MEANRDEAQQCLTVAQRAAANGDLDKAERFVRKSIHLFPTPTADAMLARIQQMRNAGQADDDDEEEDEQSNHHSTNNHSSSSSSSSSSTHRRRTTSPPKSSAAAAQAPSEPPKYTPEQREEARRICRIRDYYEILQVSRTANDVEMRSSFRRLALRLHPDKNHAPEAEEAFKKVNAAYECLSDQTKRLRYDQLGEDDSNASMSSRGGSAAAEGARREDDLSTDQIFDMFFRMAQDSRFAGGTQHFYYQQHGHQQQQQQNYYRRRAAAAGGRGRGGGADGDGSGRTGGAGLGLYQLAHLLPFIILILISLFNAPSAVDDMPFSLSRTNTFPQPRRTSHSQLDFFVGNSFQHRYARDPRALAHVEQLVELEWVRRWQASCEQERKDRRKWEKVAQEKHGDEQIRALERSQRPLESCERLQRFQAASSAA